MDQSWNLGVEAKKLVLRLKLGVEAGRLVHRRNLRVEAGTLVQRRNLGVEAGRLVQRRNLWVEAGSEGKPCFALYAAPKAAPLVDSNVNTGRPNTSAIT